MEEEEEGSDLVEEEEEEGSDPVEEEESSDPEKDRPIRSRRHHPHLWWEEQELSRWWSRMKLVEKG